MTKKKMTALESLAADLKSNDFSSLPIMSCHGSPTGNASLMKPVISPMHTRPIFRGGRRSPRRSGMLA